MKYINKLFVIVLVILILNLYLPKMGLAQQQFASADVPKHQPQSWGTEEDIPTKRVNEVSRWTWMLVIGLLGGVLAAAAGGGGGDSGSGSSGGGSSGSNGDSNGSGGDDSDDTGSYTATW